ncbi:MAG: amidohydrolase family protein [Candidatus Thorarchaeota archaeon]|jgi:5-methylthioadenosine/S-adenosylhomocysteine deaminase
MTSILIRNGIIVTPREEGMEIIEDGAIAVEDGIISAVGDTSSVVKEFTGDIVIDASHHAVIPGLIDAHIHSPLSLLRGLAQDVPEKEWMHKTMDPFAKHYTKEIAIIGSKLTVIEAVRAGTTSFCDYGNHMSDIVEQVYKKAGVRANVCSTINQMGGEKREAGKLYTFDESVGEQKLKENLALVRRWHGKADGRVTCLFGPQAADMMSKDLLLHVKELADEHELRIHMHVAQGGRERAQMEARYGISTISYLDNLGFLDSRLIAVHCHDTTESELDFLAKNGANMVGCPGSIGLIDGITPPLHAFMLAGGTAALGSDQCPPAGHNMFAQMRYAAVLSKVKHTDPSVLPAWKALRMVTIEAAKCHGLEKKVGSLETGKRADIVYQATGSEVETVIVDGRVIMDKRQMMTIDEEDVLANAQKAAENLAERAEDDFIAAGSMLAKMMRDGKT